MRKLSGLTAMYIGLALFGLASCGVDKAEESSSTSVDIKVHQTVIGEIYDESNAKTESVALEDIGIENNISDTAQFNIINVNGIKLDITQMTIADFKKKTGLQENVFVDELSEQNDDYIFRARGYSDEKKDEEGLVKFGTVVFVEAVARHDTDEIVRDIAQSDYSTQECYVKGICADAEHLSDDFNIIFDNNIKLNNSKTNIEQKIGAGTKSSIDPNTVIYKNKASTFIVTYKDDRAVRLISLTNEIPNYVPEWKNKLNQAEKD